MRARQLRQGIIVGVLLLAALWLGWLIWGLTGKAQIAVSQANDARRQYQELEQRRGVLQSNINQLQTPEGQDAAVRTAFGVARPGEEVIVLLPPATTTATTTPPWWQNVLDWL